MRPPDLADLNAFLTVAEQRSFARAAARLGLSRSRVSETIRELEERLGVRLLNRTTRSVAPTDAGERLLARLRPVLGDLDAALDSISAFRETPAGLLRLTVPPPVARVALAPLLARFLAQYPHISLEISADAVLTDIVAKRFDAGIRPDDRVERDMIAVRLGGEMRGVVVAAPSYLARRAAPKTPKDLHVHDCIMFRLPNGAAFSWPFEKNSRRVEAVVSGRLTVNDLDVAIRAALDGAGVLYTGVDYVAPMIESGRLVPLLEDWRTRSATLFLYYPSRRQVPAALQALIEFLRQHWPAQVQLPG
jgi:DNA-binding transcriptional LysR family regulator